MGGNRFVVGALQQIMLKRRHTARVALLDLDPAVIGEAGLLAAAAADAVGSSSSNPNSTPRTSGAGSAASAESLRAAASLQGPPVQHLAAFQALSQGRLPSGGWQWLPDADVALFTATNLPRLDMNFHLAPMAAPDSGAWCAAHFQLSVYLQLPRLFLPRLPQQGSSNCAASCACGFGGSRGWLASPKGAFLSLHN